MFHHMHRHEDHVHHGEDEHEGHQRGNRRNVRIQAMYDLLVYKGRIIPMRPYLLASPSQPQVGLPRAGKNPVDWAQGDGTTVPEQPKLIMIGRGSTGRRASSTTTNSDWSWCQYRMSYLILVLRHGRAHKFRRFCSRARTLCIASNITYRIFF